MDWSHMHPGLIWFVTAIILILAEFILPGLIIAFFVVGALFVAAILLLVPLNLFFQMLIFFIISVTLLLVLRKRLNRLGNSQEQQVDVIIGQKVLVKEAIPATGYGKVLYKGALWKAESDSDTAIRQNEWVEVVSHDSIVLKVRKIKQ